MENIKTKTRADSFVDFVFRKKSEDKGFRADFRHAQSPAQAFRAWQYIVPYADIQHELVRSAYALIGSSICWDDAEANGSCGIGRALRDAWGIAGDPSDDPASPAVARIRKLAASTDGLELCQTLRPLLAVIRSKGVRNLDYGRLLKDILFFDRDTDSIKARWISDFYGVTPQRNNEESK